MKGSSYSLRVMKNARTKSSHFHEQQLLGASSLAAATLHTIASRGPTPAVSPDEVSTVLILSFFHQKRCFDMLNDNNINHITCLDITYILEKIYHLEMSIFPSK